jgi:hypothetical protein
MVPGERCKYLWLVFAVAAGWSWRREAAHLNISKSFKQARSAIGGSESLDAGLLASLAALLGRGSLALGNVWSWRLVDWAR